ncbi:hypothetical protein FXO38_13845 [Capsicum annuum]|nr:hypothetical protein FXO38_13845 [Capsicum annuum]
MKWLCTILKEASKDKEKGIRRWKYKEKFSKTFCTRKVNEYGRFMSILTLNGLERSVLIVPELALNEGWSEVAFKIERFIQCPHQLKNVVQPRLFKRDLPYVKAVGESKWKSNTLGETTISYNEGDLQVTVSPGAKDTRLSRRCTVDSFKKGETELPSLLDMRRWSAVTWKAIFRINIYEMARNMFLFEFLNRNMVEQIIQREWR